MKKVGGEVQKGRTNSIMAAMGEEIIGNTQENGRRYNEMTMMERVGGDIHK